MFILSPIIQKIVQRENLSADEMHSVMQAIMQGQLSAAQLSGFLIAMRMKGETVTELTTAAQVVREWATPVPITGLKLLDLVGTGGDQANTFNISTASALVAAAAGASVAKHGNRSVSSRSGSADVLEQAGVKLHLSPEQIAACIQQVGIGFMFAPQHHTAMRHAASVRKELGVRTLFNLLGPLTNPAQARRQLVGVFAAQWVEPVAAVLQQLGSEHALVVHGLDGLDEITLATATQVAELKNGKINCYTLSPKVFGIAAAPLSELQVHSVEESLDKLYQVLNNQGGAARDIVVLNAGAAIYVAGLAANIAAGVEQAKQLLASGAAYAKLQQLIAWSQQHA